MNSQTLKAHPSVTHTKNYRAGAAAQPIFERVSGIFTVSRVPDEKAGQRLDRSPRSRYSRDILHSLPLDQKQKLGLYQLMD